MTWRQQHRVRHYVRNSIWILPALGMIAALAAIRLIHWFEVELGLQGGRHPDAVRTVLATLAASMFTFIVFVSSALLVVVQLASAQLTPRIIGVVFRDPVAKLSLTVFVFSFTLTLAAVIRITDSGPQLTADVASWSCVVSLGMFLFMIDHVGKVLRPSGALRIVARLGREVIENVYPRPLVGAVESFRATDVATVRVSLESQEVIASQCEGVILAFDLRGLAALAERTNCTIELAPEVGDFIAVGEPLFRISPAGAGVSLQKLHGAVAFGQERTMEQDPLFVFRILVDIASKGLSPAINDPTTAVLVIDQIHHLLRSVGNRRLDEGKLMDASGRDRLIYRTPNWEDFVQLAVTEIRHFGGVSIQVARRLRAMLENLIQVLPESRAAVLRRELELLRRTAERSFAEPEDRALAAISDLQGVGSRSESRDANELMRSSNGPPAGIRTPD